MFSDVIQMESQCLFTDVSLVIELIQIYICTAKAFFQI